jgi:hypothetical protein
MAQVENANETGLINYIPQNEINFPMKQYEIYNKYQGAGLFENKPHTYLVIYFHYCMVE